MEYTCFEGMGGFPFLMEDRSSFMNVNCPPTSSTSTQLLESFHAQQQQQQQLNPNYSYNPPQHFNFPAASWSTTDPTLLLTDEDHHRQQQQPPPEDLFIGSNSSNLKVSCDNSAMKDHGDDEDMGLGLPSFPSAQQLLHKRSCTDLHHHCITPSVESNRRGNTAISRCSSASTMDPFAFCGGGGGAVVNAAQPQWVCSLPSDQYYGCADTLMMPKLVSDPFSDSPPPPPHHQPPQHHHQQSEQPLATVYYTSSTSVNCMHEADSCGSSDRDRSTTSEEINWMSNSGTNNSDLARLPNLHGGCGGDSVTGLMLSSSPVGPIVELPDEYSSSIAAAAAAGVDDVELAAAVVTTTTTTTPLDHARLHHHRSTCGSGTTPALECSASAPRGGSAPTGRVSWMSGLVRKNINNSSSHITTPAPPTLVDPLLQMLPLQVGNGRVPMLPRSVLGPFKQHRAFTLDDLPNVQRPPLPLSLSSASQQQNCSSSGSGCSARFNSSVYPVMPPQINPGLVDNCTTSGSGFYKDGFHSFSSRLPQHLGAGASASVPSGGAGVREFHTGGGFEASRKDYCSDHLGLLSSGSRKPNATSIEPQSVAARHRRKKISERVRILEKLIPGGNKMDTASMLDEAIEYVKFLQLQVQLLESMGEPEMFNNNNSSSSSRMTTGHHNPPGYHPHNSSKVDSSALIGGCGFGSSSSHLSRSSTLMQQVTIAAAAAAAAGAPTSPTSSPPLILSEVLQEQLFKQKLCLVSLRQYCPQQQVLVHRSC